MVAARPYWESPAGLKPSGDVPATLSGILSAVVTRMPDRRRGVRHAIRGPSHNEHPP